MPEIVDQPAPVPNDRPAIADLVIADMVERKRIGIERYGTPLQAHNGRDALVDAYQEALDLCMYLRQAIEERGGKTINDYRRELGLPPYELAALGEITVVAREDFNQFRGPLQVGVILKADPETTQADASRD